MVELHPAFFWHCDFCGQENYCRALIPEMSDQDLEELRDEYGVESWETGHFVMSPAHVTCGQCKATHEVERDDDGDETVL